MVKQEHAKARYRKGARIRNLKVLRVELMPSRKEGERLRGYQRNSQCFYRIKCLDCGNQRLVTQSWLRSMETGSKPMWKCYCRPTRVHPPRSVPHPDWPVPGKPS